LKNLFYIITHANWIPVTNCSAIMRKKSIKYLGLYIDDHLKQNKDKLIIILWTFLNRALMNLKLNPIIFTIPSFKKNVTTNILRKLLVNC